MLQEYRKHVEERAALGIVPAPLDAQQTADLIELIKNPPAGEEEFIVDLLVNRVPPGVDDAAYIKAGFLAAVLGAAFFAAGFLAFLTGDLAFLGAFFLGLLGLAAFFCGDLAFFSPEKSKLANE